MMKHLASSPMSLRILKQSLSPQSSPPLPIQLR
jgi:hypothetical protein